MYKLTFNTVLRYALVGGLFLIPFIPLYVAKGMFFPFIVGKNFAFRILVELLFGGWLILLWRDTRYRPRFSWILAAVTLFFSVTLLADLFGENLFRSFWSNFERMDGFVGYLHFFAYFLVISSVLHTEKLWTRFFQTTLGASVIIAIYSFFQLAGLVVINQGGARIDATLGNASYLGLYALFHIFIALILLMQEKKHAYLRWVYGALALLNFVVLFNTATRGAILGLMGGAVLAALLIVISEKQWTSLRKVSLGIIIIILLLVGILFAIRDTSFVINSDVLGRVASLTKVESVLKDQSNSRFRIWSMAWEGFKEHPVLGWGQENFPLLFSKYYDPRMYAQEPWFDRAHNVVLDKLVDGGVLGFLSYLSIFSAALYYLWRMQRNEKETFSIFEKSVFTGLLAAYFFQNLFIFDQFASYFLFFSILAYLHVRSINGEEIQRGRERTSFDPKDYIVITSIVLATIFLVYVVSINGIKANHLILKAMRPQTGGISKNLEYFKEALAYDHTVGIMETREQLATITSGLASAQSDREAKDAFFTLAKTEMHTQIEAQPNDVRYRLFLANLLTSFGALEDATTELEKGIALSPHKEQFYFLLGNVYLSFKQYDKAFATFNVPFENAPGNSHARQLVAAAAAYAGKDDVVDELLGSKDTENLLANPLFVNAYASRGMYRRVAEIWEKRIQYEDPNNPQFYVSLGAAYAAAGETGKAITAVRKAIEIAPQYEAQGEELIQRIRNGDL
ncbi:MAG: hypothetical protein A3D67_04275 [Candidatus Lloydbacteria bacterium RIFCSPHIGHO2_02_FULL_51_22]|uniref:O-antigen ligase-related domain-containing protein n=2 Tax=Candidatus Lloydiibacteriota TaxID=1817910 RepID=A0A1G2DG06_9BACT|nr:MAG: hypothetical protein A3D67_04275 [Candidatus Lloydbacteria bacterium RIFCSPHIGHO2_02_FULL_51_22]OGZ14442.1 MAG: hypothetical protein A3J08_04185 [Candidatus Lloydbacteria bacterium RIFCSPLOWO2_02_FULL_51_11]